MSHGVPKPDDQIIAAVKKLEAGASAKELSREMGVTTQTLYHWKKRFGGEPITDFHPPEPLSQIRFGLLTLCLIVLKQDAGLGLSAQYQT